MAVNDRLKRYLDREHAPYETLPHREAFTARQVAAESHVPECQLAKVLVLAEEGDGHLMVVLPARRGGIGSRWCGKTRWSGSFPTARSARCRPSGSSMEYARLARPVLGEFCTHEREKSISE